MAERSPADVGMEVVAGLIAITGQRQRAVDDLKATVEAAVRELDPRGQRDPTWLEDHPWARPDGLDRLRRAFEDLWLLEVQARELVEQLRGMLIAPGPLRRSVPSPAEAHRRLVWLASRRVEDLRLIELSLRSTQVSRGLSKRTSSAIRSAVKEMRSEEERGQSYRDRLGRLLSMADLVDRAG